MLADQGIDASDLLVQSDRLRTEGQTVMLLAIGNKAAGLIGVADPVKDTTPEATRDLHAAGIKVVMLTGDSRKTSDAVAARLLYPVFDLLLSPMIAAAAMSFSSVSVISNTLRLRRAKV